MRKLVVLICAALLPHAAQACFGPILNVSGGVLTYTSPNKDLYGPEGVLAFVDNYIEGTTLLIDGTARTTRNVDLSTTSLAEIVVITGADRVVYDGPPDCTPSELRTPTELFPNDDENGGPTPIELFPDEVDAGLQPRSGLWQAIPGDPVLRGCPAMMQGMVGQMTPPVPAEDLRPRRLDFVPPFRPDQLAMTSQMKAGLGTQIIWVSVGDAAWQAEIVPEIFGQIPQGEGGGSDMLWRLSVLSEREIEHLVTINIRLPDVAAQVMGSTGLCQMTMLNTWRRIGD